MRLVPFAFILMLAACSNMQSSPPTPSHTIIDSGEGSGGDSGYENTSSGS